MVDSSDCSAAAVAVREELASRRRMTTIFDRDVTRSQLQSRQHRDTENAECRMQVCHLEAGKSGMSTLDGGLVSAGLLGSGMATRRRVCVSGGNLGLIFRAEVTHTEAGQLRVDPHVERRPSLASDSWWLQLEWVHRTVK